MKNWVKLFLCPALCFGHLSASNAQTNAASAKLGKIGGEPTVVARADEKKSAKMAVKGKSAATLTNDPAYKTAPLNQRIQMRNQVGASTTTPTNTTVAQTTSSDGKTVRSLKRNILDETNKTEGPIVNDGAETTNPDGSKTKCTTQEVKISAGYSESINLNPTAQFVFVGNILDGSTITTGGYATYNHPTVKRIPITISNDIQTTAGVSNSNKTVQPEAASGHILRGDVMNAMNNLTTSALGNGFAIPGNIGQTTEMVSTYDQIAASLNLSFDAPPASMRGSLSVSGGTSNKKSKVVVNFTQPYYAVFLDTDPKNLYPAGTVVPDHAVVVSQVTYGRLGMFIFESDESTDSLRIAVEFAMTMGQSSFSTDAKMAMERVMKKTTIKSYIMGSSTQAANEASSSLEAFLDFIKNGGNWSATQPAAPIAYCLKFIKDGQIASLHATTTFNQRNCVVTPKPQQTTVKVHINKLVPNHNGRDFCGQIAVASFFKDAAGNEQEIPGSRKLLVDVQCKKDHWWKNTKKEGHEINMDYSYTFEGAKVSTGFVRVFFDIRDGIQGIEKPFNNKDYNQYEKKQKDFPAASIAMMPFMQKMYMEGKPAQEVTIDGNAVFEKQQ